MARPSRIDLTSGPREHDPGFPRVEDVVVVPRLAVGDDQLVAAPAHRQHRTACGRTVLQDRSCGVDAEVHHERGRERRAARGVGRRRGRALERARGALRHCDARSLRAPGRPGRGRGGRAGPRSRVWLRGNDTRRGTRGRRRCGGGHRPLVADARHRPPPGGRGRARQRVVRARRRAGAHVPAGDVRRRHQPVRRHVLRRSGRGVRQRRRCDAPRRARGADRLAGAVPQRVAVCDPGCAGPGS